MIQEFHKCEPVVTTTTPEDDDKGFIRLVTTEERRSSRDSGWSSGFGGLPGLQPDGQVDEASCQ